MSSDHQAMQNRFASRIRTDDFDELAHVLRVMDVRMQQIGRGQFHGALEFVQAWGIQALRIQADRPTLARGCNHRERFTFSLVTAANQNANWRGRRLRPGQININSPGGVIDHLSSADYENLTISIDALDLREQGHFFDGRDPTDWLAKVNVLIADPSLVRNLEGSLRALIAAGVNDSALSGACKGIDALAQRTQHLLLQTLASARPLESGPPRVGDRERLFRRFDEFLHNRLTERFSMVDLCTELDVSERTLRYVFNDRFGIGPMRYVKKMRLNAVRRQLKAARSNGLAVHDVAKRWGLNHAGNFAADYQQLFGELPSETLVGQQDRHT